MTSQEECIVLVTGGGGFLGQHVIGLLQTRAPHVTEIRVIELPHNPYINKLGKNQNSYDNQFVFLSFFLFLSFFPSFFQVEQSK